MSFALVNRTLDSKAISSLIDISYRKRQDLDDVYGIEATYNTVPMDIFINRNGIAYLNEKQISAYSTFSFDYSISNYLSINYLIGESFAFNSKTFDMVNCLTFSIIPENNILEYYFNCWMWINWLVDFKSNNRKKNIQKNLYFRKIKKKYI